MKAALVIRRVVRGQALRPLVSAGPLGSAAQQRCVQWRNETRSMSASSEAETPQSPDSQERDPRIVVMEASFPHVNRHGWSKEALALGAVDAG